MLRSLELRVDRKLDGILHGQHQGLTPGHGSEHGESRPYIVGDDVRRIDWNVTARTQELHVRDLIADRDLEAWLAVDLSPSMAFGTALAEKRTIALGAAAGVGFLTARAQNRVGAVISTAGDRRLALPPRVGRDHVRALLSVIGGAPITDGTGRSDLGSLLHDVGGRARRRGFICVISDFLGDPETWRRSLGTLVARHEVLAIEIVDPRELDLPQIGSLVLRDPSTGAVREVRLTETVRRRYAEAAVVQREAIRSAVIGTGAHHLQLRTDHDWLSELIGFVHRRRRQPAALRSGTRR
ncbi:MAG: DUF58 domain-containing protein [Acidimicrobiia bacterium]